LQGGTASEEESDESDADEYCDELQIPVSTMPVGRVSVSAEAYGKYCQKEQFVPTVIPKTELQKQQ
jgi:cAMP-dependent protein kinase regulator